MSDNIPFHIQEEIMKRLPVKSLVQFRSVSKAWKSLIDSSDFIAAHSHTQPHRLFVSYECPLREDIYVLFSHFYIDDDTFHQQIPVPTLPQSVNKLIRPIVVGVSHGVLCLFSCEICDDDISTQMVVLWNPSISKSVVVIVPGKPSVCPYSYYYPYEPCVGFGVCPVTNDPKIVVITKSSEVMVYTLSSGKWRSLSVTNLPANRRRGLFTSVVVTDGFIYWDVQLPDHKMILEFDLTSESLDMIDLPDSLATRDHWAVRISKVRDSLALIHYGDDYTFSTVWIMEHGAQKSFKQLFTITTPHYLIVGFTKNGIPIMRGVDDDADLNKVVVYEPNSEHNNVLDIRDSLPNHFSVHSYMETLLLLGRYDYSP